MKFKIPSNIVKHLSNKYISLVLIIISITTILMNLYKGNLYPLIFYFIALLFLTSFNDNTNFNLLLSFIIMTVFTSNSLKKVKNEGFENKEDGELNNTTSDSPSQDEGFENTTDENFSTKIKPPKEIKSSEDDDHAAEPIQGNNKKIIQFDKDKKNKNIINYASTIEAAYSNLNKILGSDGIKNLTSDTKKLLAEQTKLAESMKNIEPLINGFGPILDKAQGLLGNIDPKSSNNIKSFAKNFSI